MTTHKSLFLRELAERGFIHQMSDAGGIDELAAQGKLIAYIGFDCTAPSLHVGSLIQIMLLHWLQKTGAGRPIALMGGGTTRVGDPSGKDETRKILSIEDIDANKAGIKGVFEKFLNFETPMPDYDCLTVSELKAKAKELGLTGYSRLKKIELIRAIRDCERKHCLGLAKGKALMPDNAQWLTKLNYIEMLRDVGRHFSVNRMLTMDSVKMRLEREQEMSFIEFNYMVCQAYDFVELARRTGCNLQMGGSDQWGNIVTGVDLGRRMGTHQLYALTTPLLTTSSGAKMGKTAAGAVWLNADRLSPYDYWQFWRNTEDADVGRFLKLFTTLPMGEIARLEALQGAEINEAKKVLAGEATALLHGRAASDKAAETARQTFEAGKASADLPSISVARSELASGVSVVALLVRAELVKSNGEAKRQIAGGGVRVNDVTVTDDQMKVGLGDLMAEGAVKLSLGKKKHLLVRVGA